MVEYTSLDVTLQQQSDINKRLYGQCKGLVEHVVAQVVTYNMAYVVLNFVVVICNISCKYSCNVLCNNTLVDCAYCYEKMFK